MESAILGSILSALATGLGAIPILFFKSLSHKWRDVTLAFTAGVMVAACTFSLIPEALNQSNIYVISIGLLMGTFVLNQIEKTVPHIDVEQHNRIKIDGKTYLIIAALCIHNIPEGLSVGVSYASSTEELGSLIALAIGLQNMPEGLLVSLFLVNQNVGKWAALGIATLTGAIEIVAALFGYLLATVIDGLVPFGLAFAAGAMLFIVYKELIPESHGDGYERSSTYSFVIGLIGMLYLTHIF
ncbi:ZIP family metal transporter [Pseudalkalibacillus decolorationis]|uniref:ZIP family metal transporter n=1 Tax=Pseudalkalibacillus decolorationis TaxID=163879 RepID=UPI002147ED20|nr:ZIP family metal transporter [Pseudalkalibacillus decolorationis]